MTWSIVEPKLVLRGKRRVMSAATAGEGQVCPKCGDANECGMEKGGRRAGALSCRTSYQLARPSKAAAATAASAWPA
jgi:hypothetical protein